MPVVVYVHMCMSFLMMSQAGDKRQSQTRQHGHVRQALVALEVSFDGAESSIDASDA